MKKDRGKRLLRTPDFILFIKKAGFIISFVALICAVFGRGTANRTTDAEKYKYTGEKEETAVVLNAVFTNGDPDTVMTRADGVEMLYQAEGSPETGSPTFSDVPADSRYANAVAWAYENKIVGGYENGLFGVNDPLSRQQFITILYRFIKSKGFGYQGAWTFTPYVTDYEKTIEYAREGICWTLMMGMLDMQNDAIRPREALTRSQAERIVSRFYDFLNDDAVYVYTGVYLGIEDYGADIVNKNHKDEFRYRFFINGYEERYGIDNGTRGDDGAYDYKLQNRLHEGEIYRFSVQYRKIIDLVNLKFNLEFPAGVADSAGENNIITGVAEEIGEDNIIISGVTAPLSEDVKTWKIISQAGGASVIPASIQKGDFISAIMNPDGKSVREIYLTPLTREYTPPVTGTPGLRTLKNFLTVSLTPVGTTLYIYGGGWNWQDNSSSEQAVTIGLPSDWVRFFQSQDAGYTYKDKNGDANLRDPAHSYYPFGEWNEYYYAGADCSGYVGWALYNAMNSQSGQTGFVGSGMTRKLTERGWGDLNANAITGANPLKPGDIVSISGHIYTVLGSCDDGSVVVLHSTPSDSRSGQPGGGVQIGAIGTSQNCTAYRLADYYMSEYYPDWYARYGTALKSPQVYFSFTSNNHGRFRWNFTGENGGLTDPDDWRNQDAEYILKNLFID